MGLDVNALGVSFYFFYQSDGYIRVHTLSESKYNHYQIRQVFNHGKGQQTGQVAH